MRSLMMLLAFSLINFASAATQTEIVIKNETSRPVHVDHFTDHYSKIPVEDFDLLDNVIAPGKKASVHFSVISLSFLDFFDQIRMNTLERDGIYLTLDNKPFQITWEDMCPFAEALRLSDADAKVVLKKMKGSHFILVVKDAEDDKEY